MRLIVELEDEDWVDGKGRSFFVAVVEALIDLPVKVTEEPYVVGGWSVEGVMSVRRDLTEEEAEEVLDRVMNKGDMSIGITWDDLRFHADELFPNEDYDEDDNEEED